MNDPRITFAYVKGIRDSAIEIMKALTNSHIGPPDVATKAITLVQQTTCDLIKNIRTNHP